METEDDREALSAMYNYSEPFSCECRAFGRLQETGYEELAVRCFGYLLLDEEHEQAMMNQFSHLQLTWNGNLEAADRVDQRSNYLGRDGRPPPIRGIVKELGYSNEKLETLRTRDARRTLRDIVRFQQLGIFGLDVASRQLIGGKVCDMSAAFTIAHFMTTPELNPQLTPEWISPMEFETSQFAMDDYWMFDDMVLAWNDEHRSKIRCHAFPNQFGRRTKYNLRSMSSQKRVYSFVDPRLYKWKTSASCSVNRATQPLARKKKQEKKTRKSTGAISKTRLRLDPKPPRWYLDCTEEVAEDLRYSTGVGSSIEWYFKDDLLFPQKKGTALRRWYKKIGWAS